MKLSNIFTVLFVMVSLFLVSCTEEEPVSPNANQNSDKTALAKKVQSSGDPETLAMMHEINEQLSAQGLNIAIEAIEYFTIGQGRPSNRMHQQPFRWVANDPRRAAHGDSITYLVDQSNGETASGLSNAQTEAAIDNALTTWNNEKALKKVNLIKLSDPGTDVTIFDWFFGGAFGDPFQADIVNAGWWPRAFIDTVVGPGGGRGVLAFSVTFIFVDAASGDDINGDGYLDTALNEVYYNNTWGDPGDDRVGSPWGIDIALPGNDVQTVALHENGHALELIHFGPPPDAVMNPIYAGIRQSPFKADLAGMNIVWASWPK